MYLILFPNVTSLLTKKEDKDMCAFIQRQKNELKGLHGIRLLWKGKGWAIFSTEALSTALGYQFLLTVYLILHVLYASEAMRENGAAWRGCLLGRIWVKEKGEVREEENWLPLVYML